MHYVEVRRADTVDGGAAETASSVPWLLRVSRRYEPVAVAFGVAFLLIQLVHRPRTHE